MSACPHTPEYPDLTAVPSFEDAMSRCALVQDDERVAKQRALTSADGSSTRIDSAYWQGLSDDQKAAVVAHERAHPAIGMHIDCEGCADKVGGYFMRAWGYCPSTVRASYAALSVGRGLGQGSIADNAAAGAKAAERAMAGRGLLGLSSTAVNAKISADRLARQAPPVRAEKPATSAAIDVKPGEVNAPALQPARAPSDVLLGTDPGGPATSTPTFAVPTTAPEAAPPSSDSATLAGGPFDPARDVEADKGATDVAGDAVAFVLGEEARPAARKVLIAAGIAAILAVGLVALYRRK